MPRGQRARRRQAASAAAFQPALETLAIVAYREPITRAEIEQIRGVNVDATMQTLMERGLVEAVGRANVVGRPPTYGTTALFLEYFGLSSLEGLPAADELRRMPSKNRPARSPPNPAWPRTRRNNWRYSLPRRSRTKAEMKKLEARISQNRKNRSEHFKVISDDEL